MFLYTNDKQYNLTDFLLLICYENHALPHFGYSASARMATSNTQDAMDNIWE